MRKNTVSVFNAWLAGSTERKQKSIWTDGVAIYSYNTPILWYDQNDSVVMDSNRYSVTTSCHQNSIRTLCNNKRVGYTNKE